MPLRPFDRPPMYDRDPMPASAAPPPRNDAPTEQYEAWRSQFVLIDGKCYQKSLIEWYRRRAHRREAELPGETVRATYTLRPHSTWPLKLLWLFLATFVVVEVCRWIGILK